MRNRTIEQLDEIIRKLDSQAAPIISAMQKEITKHATSPRQAWRRAVGFMDRERPAVQRRIISALSRLWPEAVNYGVDDNCLGLSDLCRELLADQAAQNAKVLAAQAAERAYNCKLLSAGLNNRPATE